MRFTVITISYNAELSIEKTMRSILEQTFTQDFEYILVDGASTDGTNEIIDGIIKESAESNIKCVHISEKDSGISDAFNKGVQLATGEIVSIINAGDMMLPDTLKKVDIQMTDEVDVLYGNIIWRDDKKGIKYIRKSKQASKNLMFNMDIMHPAVFVKKKAYDKIGLFDVSFRICMDQELVTRMFMNNATFKYVDAEFAEMEAGGTSDTNIPKVLKESSRIPRMYGASNWEIGFYNIKKYAYNKLSHLYWWIVK